MISAVAFVPEAPVLVPHLTGGSSPELDALRAACRVAIGRVAGAGRRLVVVGGGPDDTAYQPTDRGSLAGFGVAAEIGLGADGPGPLVLPPSLTVGAWLVRDAVGPDSGAVGYAVAGDRPTELADAGDTALVVVGDGSATRTEKAPRPLDPRGAEYDGWIADALRQGAGDMLNTLGPSGEPPGVFAAGAPVWDAVAWLVEAVEWDAELLYDAAPFGVGYFVATWTRR